MKTFATASLLALICIAGCKSDDKKTAPADKPTEFAAKPNEPAAKTEPASDDFAKSLAAKPMKTVAIEGLGLSIDVPDGTTVNPDSRPEQASRRANLKQGDFMVNVSAVDEFSTPDFAKAKEVYKDDKLVTWIRSDATPKGWITFKEVVSSMYKANRFEVGVRTEINGKKWDCSVSAPSKPLAELALAACQTLK